MVFEFGRYKVDIDVGKTRAFYETLETVSQLCSCDGCLNFERSVGVLPRSVRGFFDELGIDMRKVCECYVIYTKADGTLSYGGLCHVCGTLLEGESAWRKTGETTAEWNEAAVFPVSDGLRVSFQEEDIRMLEDGFPQPVLQIDFTLDVPWVLSKVNTYDREGGKRRLRDLIFRRL